MNEQPWPSYRELGNINVNAKSDAEVRQVFATLQNLIQQFNQLVVLGGGLQRQIEAIISKFSSLYPDVGADDLGYITNATLLDWPHDHFIVGTVVANVEVPWFDVTISDGSIAALGGNLYLDADHDFGISVSGGNLVIGAGSGIVSTSNVLQTGGYKSSDGSDGASVTTGGATFKDGLYISGTISGSGDPGTVEEVPYADPPDFYVRFNNTAGTPPTVGAWQNLATFFPGLPSPADAWAGSTDLTTLGTITTGTWNADLIELAYLQDIAANSILGNNTGSADVPLELTAAQVLTMLGYGSTAGDITTTGDASFGGLVVAGTDASLLDVNNGFNSIFFIDTSSADAGHPWAGNIRTPNRMFCPGFRPFTDGGTFILMPYTGTQELFRLDTVTGDLTLLAKIETAGSGVFGGNVTATGIVQGNVVKSNVACTIYDNASSWVLKNSDQSASLMYADTRAGQLRMYVYNLTVLNAGMVTNGLTNSGAIATTTFSCSSSATFNNATINGTANVATLNVTGALLLPVI